MCLYKREVGPQLEKVCHFYIYDTWSVFLFNRINNLFNCTSFCQVIYHGFLRCIGKCLPLQQMVMLWKIILFIKLFNLLIILFYFILFHMFIPLCLYVYIIYNNFDWDIVISLYCVVHYRIDKPASRLLVLIT